jgi:uncharacterized protein
VSRIHALVEVLARALADDPEAVVVTETEQRDTTIVELFVAPTDLGRVIGRQGRTAAALRTLVSAAAEREGKRAMLEIREPGPRA